MKIDVTSNGAASKFLGEYSRRLREVPEKLVKPAGNILLDETQKSVRQHLNKDARGELEASFRVVTGPNWAAVTSDKPYARIHDVGGTIRPKKASKLTVPIHPMAKRRTAAHFRSPNFFRLPGKNVLVFKVLDGELIPLFALVDQVQIKATHYLEKARRSARARLNEAIRASLELAASLARGAA